MTSQTLKLVPSGRNFNKRISGARRPALYAHTAEVRLPAAMIGFEFIECRRTDPLKSDIHQQSFRRLTSRISISKAGSDAFDLIVAASM